MSKKKLFALNNLNQETCEEDVAIDERSNNHSLQRDGKAKAPVRCGINWTSREGRLEFEKKKAGVEENR